MGPRPVPWNHPASATVLPHSWWKSMSTSTETLGNTQKASCGFQTTFTVHHHFYAVSVSSFHGSAGVLIFTLAPKAVCSICVDRIQLRIVDVWKLPSQTKVAIIPTRNPSVISQIFLRFSGQGLSQRNISRIIGVPQGVIPKVLRHVCETSALSHIYIYIYTYIYVYIYIISGGFHWNWLRYFRQLWGKMVAHVG